MIIPNMGTKSNLTVGEALFGKTQQRVLATLFGNPGRSFYVNEILRIVQSGRGAVQRELDVLVRSGLATTVRRGNQIHYQVNSKSAVFDELRALVVKTFGVVDIVRHALAPLEGRLQYACIYGSIAKGTDIATSDIDVLVISGDITLEDLLACLAHAERQLGRTVNPTLYTPDEFHKRRKAGHSFLSKVLAGPRIDLMGSIGE